MELRHMEAVVAVAETGGFTAAARRLHVVQSAVSGTVRALERELGVRLFERTSHRVTLTAAGEAFLPSARAALHAAEVARAAAEAAGGELTGLLTVGTMQGVWLDLHRALAALRQEHPRVVVRLHQAAVSDVRQALRDGQVDLAVVSLDRQQQRGLVTRQLAREEMVLAASPARGFGHAEEVSYAEAGQLPFVDFAPGWAIRAETDRAFRKAGVERGCAFEVNDIVAASELVRHDLGVCVMPESIAQRFPDLAVRRIVPHPPCWKVLAVRPGGPASPAVAALLRHLP